MLKRALLLLTVLVAVRGFVLPAVAAEPQQPAAVPAQTPPPAPVSEQPAAPPPTPAPPASAQRTHKTLAPEICDLPARIRS